MQRFLVLEAPANYCVYVHVCVRAFKWKFHNVHQLLKKASDREILKITHIFDLTEFNVEETKA